MIKYPLGIQTFSEIINEDYLYVDKTALLHQLISRGKNYFLSRPRRFGKSLLISTFESIFTGQKELFDGLAIAATDYDFDQYPVIELAFTNAKCVCAVDIENYITNIANNYAQKYQVELTLTQYEQRFSELLSKLHQKYQRRVVLLVDEYDKPILNTLNSPQLGEVKAELGYFYDMIKSSDKHLRFVFVTGVSKFAKVSVFSGMNTLTDISFDEDYATLCGITQIELDQYFANEIDGLAHKLQLDKVRLQAQIKHWYNGYCFEENAPGVYNPYSLLCLFAKRKFNNYWFTTATPTFLLKFLEEKRYELSQLSHIEVGEAAFAEIEPEYMTVPPLLLQTGYLTIKSYKGGIYQLDFPNYEVKKSFYESVFAHFVQADTSMSQTLVSSLIQQLESNDIPRFFKTVQQFFAQIPFNITLKYEKYWQSIFYTLLTLLGCSIEAEVHTNQGRIDCVLQTERQIYVIEFKLNDSAQAALKQIKDKQYAQKYLDSNKSIVLLGVAFDPDTRNIGEYLQEVLV